MANGTRRNNRKRILGLERDDDMVRTGEQIDNNLITDKATQTGTARFLNGKRTTRFTDRDIEIEPEITRRFKEAPEFFAAEDVEKTTEQLLKERERQEVAKTAGLRPPKEEPGHRGGTARAFVRAAKEVPPDITDLTKLKRGESIGRVTIGRETAAEEAQRKFGIAKRGQPSIFSEQGIREIFGSAADLAKVFASKEFQERKAGGIQAGAIAKGQRAESKAKVERIKALGSLRQQISEVDFEHPLLEKIDEQLEGLIVGRTGTDASQKIGVFSRLLERGFTPEQIEILREEEL